MYATFPKAYQNYKHRNKNAKTNTVDNECYLFQEKILEIKMS